MSNDRLKIRINYRRLATQMYRWRKANGLTQAECSTLIDTESLWSNLELARTRKYWSSKQRYGIEHHIGLKHFIAIIELIHEYDTVWVVLDYFDQV